MDSYWNSILLGFMNHLVAALPWILGLGAAAGLVGFSPLGRGILNSYREQRRANDLTADMSEQLASLDRKSVV